MALMLRNTTRSNLPVDNLTIKGPSSPDAGDATHLAGATIDYGITFGLDEIYSHSDVQTFVRNGSLVFVVEGKELSQSESIEFLELGSFFGVVATTSSTTPPTVITESDRFGILIRLALEFLTGDDRLDASAIQNLSVALPDTENFLLGKNNLIVNNEYFRVGANVVTEENYGGVIYQEEITITSMAWSRNPTGSTDGSVQLIVEGNETGALIPVTGSQDTVELSPPLTVSAGQRITAQWQSSGSSISTSLIFTFTRNR